MIGLYLHDFLGIGDAVQFTHIPENIYHFTGKRCVNTNNNWSLKHNPYIDNNLNPEITIDLWEFSKTLKHGFKSHAERFFFHFNQTFGANFTNPILRHPRLYLYENSKIVRNRVLVHTTGKSEIVPMTDQSIQIIEEKYQDCEIIQIGGLDDKKTPFIQKLGLSINDTLKLIASSAIFIGVNSGMMNLANCYPSIRKKIFIPRNIDTFLPLTSDNIWFDFNTEYYNYTDIDHGSTMSYLKI